MHLSAPRSASAALSSWRQLPSMYKLITLAVLLVFLLGK